MYIKFKFKKILECTTIINKICLFLNQSFALSLICSNLTLFYKLFIFITFLQKLIVYHKYFKIFIFWSVRYNNSSTKWIFLLFVFLCLIVSNAKIIILKTSRDFCFFLITSSMKIKKIKLFFGLYGYCHFNWWSQRMKLYRFFLNMTGSFYIKGHMDQSRI